MMTDKTGLAGKQREVLKQLRDANCPFLAASAERYWRNGNEAFIDDRVNISKKLRSDFHECNEIARKAIEPAKLTLTTAEQLNWIHFAIQEALGGNNGELEQALGMVEDLREDAITHDQFGKERAAAKDREEAKDA